MKILVSIANSITSRTLFDKVLRDSGLEPTEIVVTQLKTGEQRIVRWALDNKWPVMINTKNLEEVCDAVDAAIIIRRGKSNNKCDAAATTMQARGKPVHIHQMSDANFKTEFGSSTHDG